MRYRCLMTACNVAALAFRQGAGEFILRTGNDLILENFNRREALLYRLRDGNYDIVLVALPGALGMETVLGVREMDRGVPLIWASDDEVFSLEGYRLRVDMFLRLPATPHQYSDALIRCLGPPSDRRNPLIWK